MPAASGPGDTALGLLPLTLGIITSAVAGMTGPTRELGRTLILADMLLTLAGAAGVQGLPHEQGGHVEQAAGDREVQHADEQA
ncbi:MULTISPECIES: hypothetical protein [unclassified Streptomyces]|uniref:hypothetical protein n=1 Tax=unclassified Streptomyces TaxID=2593676 RepID=UPI000DC7DC01|nr:MULTISPECIES: hypothetical protein [unclassified Streptomyces]AWZ06833.1 hypothetical protein DRB89_21915 [Streptomyces sp. ICC4]AWZ12682.1 hypothetical protein DRB96_10495 [Streptomyces sp. ICC1]